MPHMLNMQHIRYFEPVAKEGDRTHNSGHNMKVVNESLPEQELFGHIQTMCYNMLSNLVFKEWTVSV